MNALLFFFGYLAFAFGACPDQSFQFQSKCYSFQPNALAFEPAEQFCVNLGGHLVSIHNGFENVFIAQEATKFFTESTVTDFWIGLTDLNHSGNWTWTDGSGNGGNFDGNTTGLDCASETLANGSFKPQDCSSLKPYVCGINA